MKARAASIRYDNLDLLFTISAGSYRVRVTSAPSGEIPEQVFTVPFDERDLENLILRLRGSKGRVRRIESPEAVQAKNRGGELFSALFSNHLETTLRRSLDKSAAAGRGLRLRLNLTDTPGLLNLPWEFLYDKSTNHFLCLFEETPVVRYLAVTHSADPLRTTPPLRVLVMISDPDDDDYGNLDVEKERQNLTAAVSSLRESEGLVLDFIPATLRDLQRALRANNYHVFHFIGHGGFVESRQDGALVLTDERRRPKVTSGQMIGTFLSGHRSLRLAVLNACEGGRSGPHDAFAGTAQTFVQQGVPAVVAMQFEITDQAAITFSEDFYASLVEGFPVDAALAEARKAIYAIPNATEWATPVLYMRSADGNLFDIESPTIVAGIAPLSVSRATTEQPSSSAPAVLAPQPSRQAEDQIDLREITRFCHDDTVWSLAFSPDGSLLASASDDHTARVSDPGTGREIARITHDSHVIAVVFSPDGSLLATASWDRTVRVSDPRTGREIVRITHDQKVAAKALAFSPEGSMLATGGLDHTARVSDPRTGREIARITHEDKVKSLAFSPEGTLLATGSSDRTARVSDPSTGTEIARVTHEGIVYDVGFSPDGSYLATVSGDMTARISDPRNGSEVARIPQDDAVLSLRFSPDGLLLATVSSGRVLRITDLQTGRKIGELAHKGNPNNVTFNPSGLLIASADTTANISDPRTGREVGRVPHERKRVLTHAMVFSPDGSLLVTGNDDNTVRVFFLSGQGSRSD